MLRKIKFAIKIWRAIRRGKKLHPGPNTISEWEQALWAEINEFGSEETGSARWRAEAVDVIVVAYGMLEAIDCNNCIKWMNS